MPSHLVLSGGDARGSLVRKFDIALGQFCRPDEVMAVFSTAPDEDIDQAAARIVRTTVAGIVHHEDMWTGSHA